MNRHDASNLVRVSKKSGIEAGRAVQAREYYTRRQRLGVVTDELSQGFGLLLNVVVVGESVVLYRPTRPWVSLRDGRECLAVQISRTQTAALTPVSSTAATCRCPTQ